MARRQLAPLLLLALATSACGDEEDLITGLPRPTEIAVDPEDFLGDTGCSPHPGAMRSYVLTLTAWDGPDDPTPFTLGSSPPTSCSLVAGFQQVVIVGKRYSAEIDGYELPPHELRPFGEESSGARRMVAVDTGQPVEPRWTTRCATGPSNAVIAEQNRQIFARPCEPLEDATGSPTAVAIGPETVLGPDPCVVAASIDIVPDDPALPPVAGLACDADPVVFDAVAGRPYRFYASATAVDGTVSGTECFVLAVEEQTVTPSCAALSTLGAARVSLAGLSRTGDASPVCPSGHFFDVFQGTDKLNDLPVGCGTELLVRGLAPGSYLWTAEVRDGLGAAYGLGALCAVDVLPGKTSDAFCLPEVPP